MAGKPPKKKKGFLTPKQFVSRARRLGFEVNQKNLLKEAREGKIPFAEPIPSRRFALLFPKNKSKFLSALKAASKRAVMPRGSRSKYGVLKLSKRKGLKIYATDVDSKLARIEAGKEPVPKGLASDRFDPWHRYILPKEFVKQMLNEAKQRKKLPNLLKAGKLIPLSQIAEELGLAKMSLHPNKNLEKIKIGPAMYVTKIKAEHFKEKYRRKKGIRLPETEKMIRKWVKEKLYGITDENRRALIWKLIRQNGYLSPKKFEKKIIPLLNRLAKGD